MSPFDEDPSENRNELDIVLMKLKQLQTENEVLNKRVESLLSKPAYVVCPKCLTKIKCI